VVVGIIVVRPVIALLATIVGEDGVAGVAVAKRFPGVKAKIARRRPAAVRVLYMGTPLLSLGGGENASTGRDAAQRDQIVQKVNTPALGFMRI
jgi:hypothetical protein